MKWLYEYFNKDKHKFRDILIFEILILIYYLFKFKINPFLVLYDFLKGLINLTMVYSGVQGIGITVLTASLVGLTLVISIQTVIMINFYEMIKNKKFKINKISTYFKWLWLAPITAFIWSISLSIIKLVMTNSIKDLIGKIAFNYFILGILFLIIWFIWSVLEINSRVLEMEKIY